MRSFSAFARSGLGSSFWVGLFGELNGTGKESTIVSSIFSRLMFLRNSGVRGGRPSYPPGLSSLTTSHDWLA